MELDLSIIRAILSGDEKNFFRAKKGGISASSLAGENAVKCWNFVNDHVMEYGRVPSVDFLQAKLGVELPDVHDDLSVLIKEIQDRTLWNRMKTTNNKLANFLNAKEPREAFDFLIDVVRSFQKDGIGLSRVESLLGLGDEVIGYYERMKAGERGIPSPWESLDNMTLGWWPGDLVIFVARMGIGKTFSMLMMARKAWLDGKIVLFVGTEMSRLKLAIRFYSIHFGLPYRDLRVGELGEFQEDEFKSGVKKIIDSEGLYVVGDDFDATINDIVAAVEEVRPDVLFVDGIYLLKNEGRDRHTRVSNTADDLKRIARKKGIPVVASTQFNREVAQNSRSSVNAANVGITDVIGWNADVMIGMYQTDDMDEDRIMGFRPIKIREGKGSDFFCNWDFEEMNFSEREDGQGGFADNDYDSIPSAISGSDVSEKDDGMLF